VSLRSCSFINSLINTNIVCPLIIIESLFCNSPLAGHQSLDARRGVFQRAGWSVGKKPTSSYVDNFSCGRRGENRSEMVRECLQKPNQLHQTSSPSDPTRRGSIIGSLAAYTAVSPQDADGILLATRPGCVPVARASFLNPTGRAHLSCQRRNLMLGRFLPLADT
jgi:hypothetical protein